MFFAFLRGGFRIKILITGGTGYLGKFLITQLIPKIKKIYILTRPKEYKAAKKYFGMLSNVELVQGDIKNPELILDPLKKEELQKETDVLVHTAGHNDLQGEYSECFNKNIVGTQNILHFAQTMKKLKFFHYMSTIAISGNYKGEISEDELDLGQSFDTHYAKTKFDAEFIVRDWNLGNVKKRIYRLGTLVGESIDGSIPRIQGPYSFWAVLARMKNKKVLLNAIKYLPMPFEKKSTVPLVPIAFASHFIASGILKPNKKHKTRCYHVLADELPTVGEFIQDSFDRFGFSVNIVPLPKSRVNNLIMDQVGLPKELLTYLYSKCQYPKGHAAKDFGKVDESLYANFREDMITTARDKFFIS